MKKTKIKELEQQILEEIKATPKEQRTERQKKIIKSEKSICAIAAVTGVGAVLMALSFLTLIPTACYSSYKRKVLEEENQRGLEQYKFEQIQQLNEEYGDRENFSSVEYDRKYDALQENYFADYFTKVASEDVKAEFQNFQSTTFALVTTGWTEASAGLLAFVGGVAAAGFTKKIEKQEELIKEELSARAVQGKGKDL